MNEGLFICELTADKSGGDVMQLPPRDINLHSAWPLAVRHLSLPSLIDSLSSRLSQCNSSHASW